MAEKQLSVYTAEQVQNKINELGLAEWYLEDGWLRRKYNTDGWPSTLMLTNAIGYLCEAAWHHADAHMAEHRHGRSGPSRVSGGMEIGPSRRSAAFHHRARGGDGVLCREPQAAHAGAAPDFLRAALWAAGLPLYVSRRAAAFRRSA